MQKTKKTKHTINKVIKKINLTDSIFFSYRYRDKIVIMKSFGHHDRVVKI